ncbi:MAG: alpha/beta hydrolase, partial [Bdellovibrionaceae bacterium]|nr:alpha/beta hydrolase [Pseudobdellovibrionaceae bacterium]
MKRIIALHGNPGSPLDWEELSLVLNKNQYELMVADSYGDEWLEWARTSARPVILLGHSWGCYRILKNLKKLGDKVERAVLVNPYLVSERPISGLAANVLKIPFVGEKIIQSNHQKNVEKFFNEMIFPATGKEKPVYSSIRSRLSDWRVWARAAEAKIAQQADPLSAADVCQTPIVALIGEEDRISTFSVQDQALRLCPHVRRDRHPREGHG